MNGLRSTLAPTLAPTLAMAMAGCPTSDASTSPTDSEATTGSSETDSESTAETDAGTTEGDSSATEGDSTDSEPETDSGSGSSESDTDATETDSASDTGPTPFEVVTTTLEYGEDGFQTLDLFSPEPRPPGAGALVLLAHGGLWQAGSKGELATACTAIVSLSDGAIRCASMDYRLSDVLGGLCEGDGPDSYREQLRDMATAFALLREQAEALGVDPERMYVGGHSAGGHLAQTLNLRWSSFDPGCAGPGDCPPAAGAIGFEGIYDVGAWDAYDLDHWGGTFQCATRKAFGQPPQSPDACVDPELGVPCWIAGSPTALASDPGDLGVAPVGDILVVHAPGDDWVAITEATAFGAAVDLAFPDVDRITTVDGTCGTGRHFDLLEQAELPTCIVNFVASAGASIE